MLIKPSASIRQNYNGIAALCKYTRESVYLTKLDSYLESIISEVEHGN